MSDLIRCQACKGQKKVVGLGLLERDCQECGGVGHVKNVAEVIAAEPELIVEPSIIIDETAIELESKPKRGRKK